jgi:hypothetical protein
MYPVVGLRPDHGVLIGVRTQVGHAALPELSTRHIAAYLPEARGHSERAFRAPQDRLPKEAWLVGGSTCHVF